MNNRIIFGLAKQAKAFVEERGGSDALNAEAKRLQGIVKSKGSISDKAKEAAASAQAFAKAKPGQPSATEPTHASAAEATHPASAPVAPAPVTPPSEPPAFAD